MAPSVVAVVMFISRADVYMLVLGWVREREFCPEMTIGVYKNC